MTDYTADWLRYKRSRNELLLVGLTSAPVFVVSVLMSVRTDHFWLWWSLPEILNIAWTAALISRTCGYEGGLVLDVGSVSIRIVNGADYGCLQIIAGTAN
jgi:hypothetical protein